MARRYSSNPQHDRSLKHSLRDGVAFSVMTGGGESYFSAFALHFKATVAEVGVLSSLPPLIGSFFQLLSVTIGRQLGNRRHVIMLGAGVQVFSWLPLTLLPILYPDRALLIILLSLILFYAAGNLVTPQWTSLMGDLVPERSRGRYFSHRSRLASITGLVALIGGGFILQSFTDSLYAIAGFVSLFAVAAVARLVSAYHMACMVDPPLPRREKPARDWLRAWWGTPALRYTGFYALMQFSVAISGPFFTVYMLRDLDFTYVQFMANTAASVLAQFLTLRMWGRIGDAFGHRLVLACSGFLIPAIPALWLFSGDFWYLLAVQVVSGVFWGGFTLSATNILYDLVPSAERVPYLASHNVSVGIGTFAGALLGGGLSTRLPDAITVGGHVLEPTSALVWLFLISAAARLAVAIGFLSRIPETRAVRPLTWRGLAFRITGLRRCLRPRGGGGEIARVSAGEGAKRGGAEDAESCGT
ncbi:MAG: MFS transporter [Gammaproteobacteria bacterium]|nr:MFS transporter [Gammaproteobacteria bacterium]